MLKYYRLFDLINRRGMRKTDLLEIVSAPTLAKLGKGKNVETDVIDKICTFLSCQPQDIMEHIIDEFEIEENKNVLKKMILDNESMSSEIDYDIRETNERENEIEDNITFDDILDAFNEDEN